MREADDWKPIYTALGFQDEYSMLVDLYITHEMSIGEISKRLGFSTGVVRRKLVQHKIERRGRGGPNRHITSKLADVPDEKFGDPVALAKELGMHYSSIYKEARRRGLCISALSPQPESSTDTPQEVSTISYSPSTPQRMQLTLSGIEEELLRESGSSSTAEDMRTIDQT